MKLTAKQQAWIDYYKQGHTATEAARLAGYKGNNLNRIGSENLSKLDIYIQGRDAVLESPRIADMAEINAFWSDTMRDDSLDRKDRLKASELRARAAGMFTDRVQVSGSVDAGLEKLDNIIQQLRGDDCG
ncbi:MAG: terminase small subunit [Acutalibacteraceae bacterium]|jgi:terminase small subunit